MSDSGDIITVIGVELSECCMLQVDEFYRPFEGRDKGQRAAARWSEGSTLSAAGATARIDRRACANIEDVVASVDGPWPLRASISLLRLRLSLSTSILSSV